MRAPQWLNDAVFYNVYPQSFYDANGDGIGDLKGIAAKLDYVVEMGYTAIWLNPIFVSPFRDAGYDITDFYTVAPRYGTNEDFAYLTAEAKKRGIKVVLDLVAGHTSLECAWFQQSAKPEKNRYTNRYVWSNSVWDTWGGNLISGYSDRDGCYMKNFFYCQPALNYGFKTITEPWQLPMDHPDCLATREELLNVMRHWSKLGADGFRVDLASSLVKNDPTGEGIIELWNDIIGRYKAEYPDNVLIAEWCNPKRAIPAGFDIDFLIHSGLKAYTTLFRYEAGTSVNDEFNHGDSYFRRAGKGSVDEFLPEYLEHYHATRKDGFISIPTGNHDIPRLAFRRDESELKVATAFLLTMPGVPLVYYGDEIGMRYIEGMSSKEGGFNRTGSRTPMQWDDSKNHGFSLSDTPYLPTDPSDNAPTVAAQREDPHSLLNHVKALIALRKKHPALMAQGDFEVIATGYPFVYKRTAEDETVVVAVNPSDTPRTVTLPPIGEVLLQSGVTTSGDTVTMDAVSYLIYKL
ncbi:MAG: DUF3459 domain-containing protein [Clostridia bacterium]|nr:DUF3459 domain-containing protein [Clostridia bacterium]